MARFDALSPKRHLGLTNNVWTDKLNKGKLTKQAKKKCSLKTVDRTISKSGKKGYKGNKSLKSTQFKPQLASHMFMHGNNASIAYPF